MFSIDLILIAVFCVLQMTLGKPTDIDREKSDHEFVSMCKSRKILIDPDELTRKWLPEENWVFDSSFSQRIEGDVCEDEGERWDVRYLNRSTLFKSLFQAFVIVITWFLGSPCNNFPLMKTRCIQKYLTIKLQVVSKGMKSEIKSFPIPSYCDCAFLRRKTGNNSKSLPKGDWKQLEIKNEFGCTKKKFKF